MGRRRVGGELLPVKGGVDGLHLFHLSLDDLSVVLDGFCVVVVVDEESAIVGLSPLWVSVGFTAAPSAEPRAEPTAAATADGRSTGFGASGLLLALVVVDATVLAGSDAFSLGASVPMLLVELSDLIGSLVVDETAAVAVVVVVAAAAEVVSFGGSIVVVSGAAGVFFGTDSMTIDLLLSSYLVSVSLNSGAELAELVADCVVVIAAGGSIVVGIDGGATFGSLLVEFSWSSNISTVDFRVVLGSSSSLSASVVVSDLEASSVVAVSAGESAPIL